MSPSAQRLDRFRIAPLVARILRPATILYAAAFSFADAWSSSKPTHTLSLYLIRRSAQARLKRETPEVNRDKYR
jgi:hypothetical protein